MRYRHGGIAAILVLLLSGSAAGNAAPPQRIVSTNLCTDEYLFRLVPRARIAALSFEAGDRHPVVSTIADKVGSIRLIRPSAETILILHPDLVLLYQGAETRLRAQLVRLGMAVFDLPWANSLDDIRRITRQLAARLDAQSRGEQLIAEMGDKLGAAHQLAVHPPVRALIYEANGYATSGGVTDAILAEVGLRNVASAYAPTRLGTIPVEAVITSAPDLLLLNSPANTAANRADLVLRHPALRALDDHTLVERANLTPLLCAGPWSADVATPLAVLGRKARTLVTRTDAN